MFTKNPSNSHRNGMTLIEILAALMIAGAIAALGIQYIRPAGETAKQHSCDLTRQLLQNDAGEYQGVTGRTPSVNLRELANPQYSGSVLPVCPITGEDYSLDRSGTVACPTHEATRG